MTILSFHSCTKLNGKLLFSSLSLSSTLLLSLPVLFFFPSSSLSPSLSAPEAFLFSSTSIFLIYALSVLIDSPFCYYCYAHFLLRGAQGWQWVSSEAAALDIVEGKAVPLWTSCVERSCPQNWSREGDVLFPVLHRFSQPQRQGRYSSLFSSFLPSSDQKNQPSSLRSTWSLRAKFSLALWVYSTPGHSQWWSLLFIVFGKGILVPYLPSETHSKPPYHSYTHRLSCHSTKILELLVKEKATLLKLLSSQCSKSWLLTKPLEGMTASCVLHA